MKQHAPFLYLLDQLITAGCGVVGHQPHLLKKKKQGSSFLLLTTERKTHASFN